MADLSPLRSAVTETVDRAEPPAFDTLVRRARTRRRRRTLSAAAVAAAVLAGTAALLHPGGAPSSAPSPADGTGTAAPSRTPGTALDRLRAMSAQDILERGRLYSYGSDGSGVVLTVRQVCVHGSQSCRYAWRLGDRSGEVAQGLGSPGDGSTGPTVRAGGGAFVLKAWNRPGYVVEPDGTVRTLRRGHLRVIDQGTVAVRSGARGMELVDTRTGQTQPLPAPRGSEAVDDAQVAADGTVWTLPAFVGPGRVEVSWRRDGTWHSHVIDDPTSTAEVPGLLALSGSVMSPTRVAALSSYDGATVLQVGVLAVSSDGGASWVRLTRQDLPFGTVDSMAATAGGTLFVAEPGGTLWRSTDGTWTRFARVAGVPPVSGLRAAGEQVLARAPAEGPGSSGSTELALIGTDGTARPVPLE